MPSQSVVAASVMSIAPSGSRLTSMLRVQILSKNTLAEFQAEVVLLAGVPRHDHVVGLLGICVDTVQHVYMMVLEWMERGSRYDFIRQSNLPAATPLSLLDRLRLILQCVKAVNHLHLLQRPIVHGDAKSANFLLNSHEDVKAGQSLTRNDPIHTRRTCGL
jgi:serine/threonine protein kinase